MAICTNCGNEFADVDFDEFDFCDVCEDAAMDELENDGQPDEYTEWQDFNGGDDWDHGQFDDYDSFEHDFGMDG